MPSMKWWSLPKINRMKLENRANPKPLASLSLDLDDKWTYLRTTGDTVWSSYPTYIPTLLPRIFDFLDKHKQKNTFFVVGKDADLSHNRSYLQEIKVKGHEVANHSYSHKQWMHKQSDEFIKKEIIESSESIAKATGSNPISSQSRVAASAQAAAGRSRKRLCSMA